MDRLYTEYQWEFMLKSTTLSFGVGVASASIATDYKHQFHCKWVNTDVSPTEEKNVTWLPYAEFIQREDPNRQGTFPRNYTTYQVPSVSGGSGAKGKILIHPVFATADSLTQTYYAGESSIGTSATPAFPNHSFLVDALINELWKYNGDPRHDPMFIERYHRRMGRGDKEAGVSGSDRVRLDPTVFGYKKRRRY